MIIDTWEKFQQVCASNPAWAKALEPTESPDISLRNNAQRALFILKQTFPISIKDCLRTPIYLRQRLGRVMPFKMNTYLSPGGREYYYELEFNDRSVLSFDNIDCEWQPHILSQAGRGPNSYRLIKSE